MRPTVSPGHGFGEFLYLADQILPTLKQRLCGFAEENSMLRTQQKKKMFLKTQ